MLDEVTAALAAIESQGEYAAELGLGSEALHIVVQGVGPLHFPISAATAKKLCAVAEPAPFGRGSETLHDPRVRDTGQIDRSRIKVDTRRWRRALEPVLATLRQRLGLAEGVELAVVLDKLLVYGPGQFFAPHQDTERDDDMVGSLVVTLPSSYEGGSIVVKHHGEAKTFRGAVQGGMDVSILAFYADCRHEVKPVRSGHRIALTYHLLRRGEARERPQLGPNVVERLAGSVEAFFSTPVAPRYGQAAPQRPDRLVYLLDHEYTQKSLGWDHLKNADRLRAAALREVAGRLDCELYLALADVHEVWQCEDDWYGYGRRGRRYDEDDEDDPSGKADHKLVDLVDESISLEHWIDADGQATRGFSAMPADPEICFTRPSVEMDPFKSEYEGYMGNYGDTMDRWYHRAAIVMWPRARNFVIPAKMSPSWAVGEIAALTKAGAVDEARGRARELLPFWSGTAPSEASATFVPRLLAVLAVLDDEDLAFELLSPLGPHRLDERTMTAFAALVERYGLAWAKRLFTAWADEKRHPAPPWLASLARLCEALTASGEHGRALALWLLAREVATFRRLRIAECRGAAAFAEELAGRRVDDVVALFAAAAAIPARAIRDDLVAALVAPETKLPLVTAGALLRKLCDERTPAEVRALGLQALYSHVVGALAAALATPERSRDDWTIEAPTRCACALCQTLASFLRDRGRTRHAWPLAKEKRSHVHAVIDANRLPVTHTTTRQGSPFTLVLTKQATLFEREAAERSRWKALLTRLEGQHDIFAADPAATRMTPSAHRGAGRVASKRRSPPIP
jgi:predicted 2-oxoglutarate/Fe(II)-dependent dioxygenase YbiX